MCACGVMVTKGWKTKGRSIELLFPVQRQSCAPVQGGLDLLCFSPAVVAILSH